jgi:hypothetical protein
MHLRVPPPAPRSKFWHVLEMCTRSSGRLVILSIVSVPEQATGGGWIAERFNLRWKGLGLSIAFVLLIGVCAE